MARARSLSEFQKAFSDEASCVAFLFKRRWPDGFICAFVQTRSAFQHRRAAFAAARARPRARRWTSSRRPRSVSSSMCARWRPRGGRGFPSASSRPRSTSVESVTARGLGTPKEGRLTARAGQIENLFRIYDAHLATTQAREELDELTELVCSGRRVCLLCYERDPDHCHRKRIAALLHERIGVAIEHLFAAPPLDCGLAAVGLGTHWCRWKHSLSPSPAGGGDLDGWLDAQPSRTGCRCIRERR